MIDEAEIAEDDEMDDR